MTRYLILLLAATAAYLVGSIPFGLLLGRANGIDIRKHGSGNIGATNVTRVLGRDWGICCFLLDFSKGLVPVLTAQWLTDASSLVPIVTAGAAVSGHIWPLYLRFKGGKGVASSIGALLALAFWQVMIAAVGWYVIFKLTRYVSVASMAAALLLPISTVAVRTPPAAVLLLSVIALIVLVRHRENVIRLLEGRENRFSARAAKAAVKEGK
jgi:glycerol-3-phosphate acyltransferase PlsY